MLGLITAISSAVAGISSVAVSSIPLVGPAIASASSAIGTAVSGAVTGAGASEFVGGIVANSARTAINGAAYKAYNDR